MGKSRIAEDGVWSRALELMGDALVVLDAEGRVDGWNDNAERLYGIPAAEATGRPFAAVVEQRWLRPADERAARRAMEGDGRWRGPCVHITRRGRVLHVELAILGRHLMVRDRTLVAEALDALHREKADVRLARRVVGFASYSIAVAPTEGTWWSDELLHILGLVGHGPTALSHQEFLDRFVHPEDRGWVADAFATAAARGQAFEAEYRIVRADGAVRWVHSFAHPERAAGAEVVRLSGLLRDITDRKEVEWALEQTRRLVARIVETIPVGVVVVDVPRARCVFTNLAASRIVGRPGEALLALDAEALSGLLHPEDRPAFDALWHQLAADEGDGDVVEGELRIRHTNGGWRRVHGRLLVFERAPDGTPTRLLGSVEDVTERRRAEAELELYREHLENLVRRRTASLRSLNAELGAFAHTVSHDLRSPLRVIANLAELTLEDCGAALNDEGRENLERIIGAAHRASGLVRRLVDMGRVEGAPLEITAVDLSAIARRTVDDLRQQEPEREVEVRIADGVVAEGDAVLLEIVLGNLLGNAWKFTRERPRALLEFAVDPDAAGGPAYFVRDNGVGFDPAQAERLFTPFETLHRRGRFGGSGIGLATVEKAVRRLGGRIHAVGAPGRGATFWFTLAPDAHRKRAGPPDRRP